MSNTLHTAAAMPAEQIPLMITAASAAVGAGIEARVERLKSQEDQRFTEVSGVVSQNMQPGIARRLARKGLGLIAVSCALAGGINAYSHAEQEDSIKTTTAGQLVADFSGDTERTAPNSEEAPISRIKAVVKQFNVADGYNFSAQIGKFDDNIEKTPAEILNETPFSSSNLSKAYSDSINQLTKNGKPIAAEGKTPIVMITNGNGFGEVNKVVKRANTVSAAVSIVNVADSPTQSQAELQAIAKQTGGQYWNANKLSDIDNIAEAVKADEATAVIEEIPAKRDPGTAMKVFGLLAALAVPLTIRAVRNSREPDQYKAPAANQAMEGK